MFRFTIRELVLLTLVVAMGVGWWVERGRLTNSIYQLREVLYLWAEEAEIRNERYEAVVETLEGHVPESVARESNGRVRITTKAGTTSVFEPSKRPE